MLKKVIGMFIIVLLTTLAPLASAEEKEIIKIPTNSMVKAITGHPQEHRWIKVWTKALEAEEGLRPNVQEDTAWLQALVLVEFCEKTETIGVATTVIFVSPWFGGQNPWILSNLKVLEIVDWEPAAKDLVDQMLDAWDRVGQSVLDSVIYLSTDRSQGLSVKLTGDEYDWETPFSEERDPFDITPFFDDKFDICAGTDFMFHMSNGR